MQIYINRNNQQLGPFTEAEVKAQLASGTISLQDHVWWQGQANWVTLAQSPFAASVDPTTPGATPPIPAPPAATTTPYPVGSVPVTSNLAIWALVCGCLGLFLSLLASIPAIVLGHLSLSQIKKNPALKGHGMALAGLILGYVFTFLLPIISIVAISVLIALGNQVKDTFKTINSQLAETATNSPDQSATNADQATNAPDQNTPTATPTNGADQSTNAADQNTPTATPTNTPDSSTNTPDSATNAAPMNQ